MSHLLSEENGVFRKSIILYVHTHFRRQRSVLRYPFFKWRGENVFRAEKAYAIV